jgi:hypothetical protein
MVGCTLEDCLNEFIIAEHVENYHCSHCWHIAGIKYLSSVGGNEVFLGFIYSPIKSLAFWPDLPHGNNEVSMVLFATPLSCLFIIILLIKWL